MVLFLGMLCVDTTGLGYPHLDFYGLEGSSQRREKLKETNFSLIDHIINYNRKNQIFKCAVKMPRVDIWDIVKYYIIYFKQ